MSEKRNQDAGCSKRDDNNVSSRKSTHRAWTKEEMEAAKPLPMPTVDESERDADKKKK